MFVEIKVKVEITTSSTWMWSGKVDKEGNEINEQFWKAYATIKGVRYAETEFGETHKTEASAIKALKKIIKEMK